MGRKHDFPELKAMNLYAVDTTGNGNCLFNALSDQLFGDQSQHVEFRAATIEYMRTNAEHFKSFIVVHPGGGTRRSNRIPKRKNPGALAKSAGTKAPTSQEVESTFQQYLKTMAQGGAYGDNLEIVAFANVYKVDVCIYSEQMSGFFYCKCQSDPKGVARTVYIVHHAWEHFSSIRNLSGPHTGLPNVIFVPPSAEAEASMKDELANHSYVQSWMVETIQRSLPYATSREIIAEALQAYKGNINHAVSSLMPASSSSSNRSSSIERDVDSDDEVDQKPKKKADRRPSRPHPLCVGKSNQKLTVGGDDAHSLSPNPRQLSAVLSRLKDDEAFDPDETEEEDWQNDSTYKDSETTSVSTSASDSSAASNGPGPTIRIRLSQPKKPIDKVRSISPLSSGHSNAGDYDADGEKPALQPRVIAKPKRRLISRNERDRLDAEKAEKAEKIEKTDKAARRANLSPTSAKHKKSNQSPPVIDVGIKVLRI